MMKNSTLKGLLHPSIAARGCLRDIGKEVLTQGAERHERTSFFFGLFPVAFRNMIMFKVALKMLKRDQEEAEKNKKDN